ncbi:MAG: hypothetical protein JJ891_05525 [Rhizobiaceae bacterium]|jgi:hypothetical protein|nr:hypothetical protein [Rhizobiaceae bacterium]
MRPDNLVQYQFMKAVGAVRRTARSQPFALVGQVALVVVQVIFLVALLDWIVSSLLNLPLEVTLIVTMIIMTPAFYLCWMILQYFSDTKTGWN